MPIIQNINLGGHIPAKPIDFLENKEGNTSPKVGPLLL